MGFFNSFIPLILLTFIPSTFQTHTHQCPSTPPSTSTLPLPPFSLPTSFPNAQHAQDPIALDQIRNTLGLYPLALDGKNFGALDRVFTPDAIANYSTPIFVLKGLSAIQARIEAVLVKVGTQHSYGTQVIEIGSGGCEAKAVTYFTATHFGRGVYLGEVYYAYGQYQDSLVRVSEEGEWRVKERNLVYLVSDAFFLGFSGDVYRGWVLMALVFLGTLDWQCIDFYMIPSSLKMSLRRML